MNFLKKVLLTLTFAASAFLPAAPAGAQELSGDTRLACEALLCLAAPARPGECAAAIARFFSISFRKLGDTLKGRLNFLNLCPVASSNPQMASLAHAIANGAGRCDAESLNTTLRTQMGTREDRYYVISSAMPGYCTTYISQPYANFAGNIPQYVGTPERGGFWVEAKDYNKALAAYKARLAAELEAAEKAAANDHGS